MHFQRILLPVDFSRLSELAADYVRSLATRYGASVHAIHVVPVERLVSMHAEGSTAVAVPAQPSIEEARASLERFAGTQLEGLEAHCEVLCGPPALEIARYAAETGCDVVVMGTHADGILKRLVFGSVSKAVLESVGCAVLLVPLAAAPEP